MLTVKFGSDATEFKLAQEITAISDDKIQVAVLGEGTEFDALDKALQNYGGSLTAYEDGNQTASYSGFEEKPSVYATYYTIGNNAERVYQIVLTKVLQSDLDKLNASITSLDEKTGTIEKDVQANTSDVASALEGIASLFEMVTAADAAADTAADTTADATSESESTSETASETDTTSESETADAPAKAKRK